MARRRQPDINTESIREELVALLANFGAELQNPELRAKVKALIPAFYKLRELGKSLIHPDEAANVYERIITYLKRYPHQVIEGDELMVISGIGEWARRLRELRVQFGWWIYSGMTFREMAEASPEKEMSAGIEKLLGVSISDIKPDQYVLMQIAPDRDAAYRWNELNQIRKQSGPVKEKLIAYLRRNVGKQVTGEELKYLARDKKEWARRVRELRTEDGWPIATKNSGREELPIGVYVLDEDRQSAPHDRKIPDPVRVEVLRRDGFKCTNCGWSRKDASPDDPRKFLELHHVQHHRHGGENIVENLTVLCNVCHDKLHKDDKLS